MSNNENMLKCLYCKYVVFVFILLSSLFFGACSTRSAKISSDNRYAALPASQKPYEIFGKMYYPVPTSDDFIEEGVASWYGKKFHGRSTSSGEIYDMYGMTAAHKTLPLGTLVKVTNRENEKYIVVRINDRGPFVAGRIIDLTYAAAQKLGIVDMGTAFVHVEALQPIRNPDPDDIIKKVIEKRLDHIEYGLFMIQIGSYQQLDNAIKIKKALDSTFPAVTIEPFVTSADAGYRVIVGTYNDLSTARNKLNLLKEQGYSGAFVVAVD